MITLTVLGCDGSYPGPGGAASGYLVRERASATAVVLDLGPGTFANLQRFCDPLALSAVVLSHEHPDHFRDIESFHTAAKWVLGFDRDPIPVFAAPGISEKLDQHTAEIFDWREVDDDDEVRVGPLSFRFSRTDHPPVTLAVRVEGPTGTLGYSADSGPGWTLRNLGTDLDLALCEATYTSEFEGTASHMSGRQAAASAEAASARRLVLTHRWPTVSEADIHREVTKTYRGRVDHAAVGRGYSI